MFLLSFRTFRPERKAIKARIILLPVSPRKSAGFTGILIHARRAGLHFRGIHGFHALNHFAEHAVSVALSGFLPVV